MGPAGKEGILRVYDRTTHALLHQTPITTIDNAEAPVTTTGTHACPGVFGEVEWNGPAYTPGTNLLYTAAVDWCGTFMAADSVRYIPGKTCLGGKYEDVRATLRYLDQRVPRLSHGLHPGTAMRLSPRRGLPTASNIPANSGPCHGSRSPSATCILSPT